MAQLSVEEVGRYGRQLILPEWGRRGQESVKANSVLIVGVGGLGCPCALYLAAAGIGRLGLLDYDRVELSNLHRQVLHCENRVGVAKTESGRDAVKGLNSHVSVTTHTVLLDSTNALSILSQYDIIVDATDNVATRSGPPFLSPPFLSPPFLSPPFLSIVLQIPPERWLCVARETTCLGECSEVRRSTDGVRLERRSLLSLPLPLSSSPCLRH
jgi:hypothetical protein